MSPSDLSELTKSFDITTEPQAEESDKKDSEEDYEVVPADSCDDGEWVDVLGIVVSQNTLPSPFFPLPYSEPQEEDEEETEPTEESAETTTEGLETAYSIYDIMMSDGTTINETPLTGSGDYESTLGTSPSPEVTDEGSGIEPLIVTDEEPVR